MRIAYVYLGASLRAVAGVNRKLLDQATEWTRQGHTVAFYLQLGDSPDAGLIELDWDGIPVQAFAASRAKNPLRRYHDRRRAVDRLVDAVLRNGADIVYLRFTVFYPALSRLLRMHRACIEVNSDDLAEHRRQFGPLRYAYHRLTRHRLMRGASGVVFVTQELAERPHFAKYGHPYVVISNGIDFDRVPEAKVAAPGALRLAFIGEPGLPWHGVDKILRLARALPECQFDLIGYAAQDLPSAAPTNVRPLGYVTGEGYRAFLDGAVAGIGTLALHRKGMDEACPLKVRDYLAAGLPVIIGYRDSDLGGSPWFVLQLPNTEDNVDGGAAVIRAFLGAVGGRRVQRAEIAHLHTAEKERQRLAFMASLLDKGVP